MFKSASLLACLVFVLVFFHHQCLADVNSGCPSWGCLPWGSFSLSSGVPSPNSTIPWRVGIEAIPFSPATSLVPRGCVSDQQTVVCTTETGYVSVDPTNGKKLWNYTTMSSPYLPIMDIYGDVIGMDMKALYYVGNDGKPNNPIDVSILKPLYGLMVGNNSIMFLTASKNNTAQIVTYGTNGIVSGAIQLKGSLERSNGSFIPCSQPIIAGFRAYIMTYFHPDDMESEEGGKTSGMLRLYAIDMIDRLGQKIVIAWYFNFGKWKIQLDTPILTLKSDKQRARQEKLDPIVTYFSGNIYVNVPGSLEGRGGKQRDNQPYPGSLWAIKDEGKGGTLVFRTSCIYGHMAVFDTYNKPFSKPERKEYYEEEEHLVWIMNRSPAMIQGYNSQNGTVKPVRGFDVIFEKLNGWITSSLSITRSGTSNNDQIVFGTTDQSSGEASISVVEVDDDQAKLVLSRVVSKATLVKSSSRVEGQIVNFAFYPPAWQKGKSAKDTWKLGLAAVVTETNSTSLARSVVGVF